MKRKPVRIKGELWKWIEEYLEARLVLADPYRKQHARIKHCEVMINALMDELESL